MALLATIALGIAVEYTRQVVGQWRIKMSKMATYQTPRAQATYMCLYVLTLLISYIAMLVAMSYSVELLTALITGLAVGHYLFAFPEILKGEEKVNLFEKPPCC